MSQDLIVSGDTYEGVERVAATNTEGGLVVYGDGDGEASSPTIAVAPIEGGYRITVTDVAGSRSFDMKNGLSPTINITETPFADANGAGSAIKITCVSKDPVTGEETESSETVYVRNGKNGLHGTDVTLDITRQSGDDPGWWFKKKQTVYNADGTTKVTETTDFIPVSDDFVIAKISGSLRDDTLEWEYTVLWGENPAPAAGLNALVESGKIVIGVADGDLGFRFFADEAYNDSYVVPSGTVFNYNNGTFWFSNFADKDGEIKNMAFAIKAGYKDSPWWGMTYPSQYTIYLTGDQPGRIVECFGRKLEPREAYEILLDAANNDIPLLCYQKDAVFKLEDGSTHTPQYGTPFYYDHNTELLHCEHDGYACTLYVDLDVYNATAEKNTPYKTAESKADDLKAEDGTLFLLSAGEPIGAGVPLPTGNADDCKIFIADLNTSTYEDIKAADDAGKICYALWGGYTPCLLTTLSPESAIFTTLLDPYHGKYVKFTKGTVGVSDFGLTESHSVLYEQQSLTDAQKAQARENIGALSADDIDVDSIGSNVFVADYDTTTFAEIKAAHDAGKVCFLNFNGISLPLLGTNDTEAMFVREINENTDYRVTITSAGGKDFTIVDKNISDVYVVSLFSAKYADVKAAYEAGKACFVTYGALLCPMTVLDEEKAEFVGMLTPHMGIKGIVPAEGTIDWTYVRSNAVQTVEQSLSDDQKTQARTNIGAAAESHNHDAGNITSGVLPLARGGTGTSLAKTNNAIIRFSGSGNYFSKTATANGAMYATSANGAPVFGTLPIAQGGTGATDAATARANIGAAAAADLNSYLPKSGGTITGALSINDKLTQGSPSGDASVASMNRFHSDLFVQGNGTAPNTPTVAGFYLGKSTSDENRHMDIVSGGDYSYIDFNKAGRGADFDARLLVNVSSGWTDFTWGSHGDITQRVFNVNGSLRQNGTEVLTWGNAGTDSILPVRLRTYQDHNNAVSDPNLATETGFYYVNTATNRPPFSQSTNPDYRVLTTAYSDQWLQQIATDFRCGDMFLRRRENGTWTQWVRFATAGDLGGYLPLAGGLLGGSLKFQASSLPQKSLEYVCGIDAFASGGEMGWQSKAEFLSGYLTTTGTAARATADANGNNIANTYAKVTTANDYNGEQRFKNAAYCPTITDTASGIGCAFKASRGMVNELLADKIIATASTGKIPFYSYTGASNGSMTGLTEFAYLSPGAFILRPPSGEGGQIQLEAAANDPTNTGICIDTAGGNFRIFGLQSADGTTTTGYGSVLAIHPYAKVITGGYSFDGIAAKATADGNGRNIVSTYATKTEVTYAAGGPLIVTVTGNDTNGYAADKTYDEILSAWDSGRDVIAKVGEKAYRYSYCVRGMAVLFSFFNTGGTDRVNMEYIVENLTIWHASVGFSPTIDRNNFIAELA